MANPYASPFGNNGGSNPYALNPFGQKRSTEDVMDEDEDDDLVQNTTSRKAEEAKPASTEPLTERQRMFAKFKKLQQLKATEKPFITVGANKHQHDKKKKKQHVQSLHSAKAKTNTNTKAKPRAIVHVGDAKEAEEEEEDIDLDGKQQSDYIYFHELHTSQQQESGPKSLKKAENAQRQSQFEALNLESSTLNPSNALSANFDALSKAHNLGGVVEVHTASYRSIRVPAHRMVHVRRMWKEICNPVVKQLKLQIRMNSKKNVIELRQVHIAKKEEKEEKDKEQPLGLDQQDGARNAIQKGSDFIRAAVIGFELRDALALIRMDDIYLESFDIRDVKFFNKKSDHWMRAIGRIAGQYGKIKYSIENSTNTRIVIFGFKVHILGSFSSIRLARNSISRLIMGSAPGNVYAKLRVVSNRLKHKF